MTRISRIFQILMVLGLAIAFLRPGSARANGVPTSISLAYLPGVTTLNDPATRKASGVADTVLSEGIIHLSVRGLPRLSGNESYQGWLWNKNTGKQVSFGDFNTDPDGTGSWSIDVPPTTAEWTHVVITVHRPGDPTDRMGPQRSIAGVYVSGNPPVYKVLTPLPGTPGAPLGTPTLATPVPGVVPHPTGTPDRLPFTGNPIPPGVFWTICAALLLALLGVGSLVYHLVRKPQHPNEAGRSRP